MSYPFDPTRPIYLQIMEWVKRRAVRGDLKPGQQIPSVRDLARMLGVNPNTVARAYMELEREGFIFSRRGQGSFVTEDPTRIEAERQRMAEEAAARFWSEIEALGLSPEEAETFLEKVRRKGHGGD